MKKSHIAVLVAVGFILVMIIVVMGLSRLALEKAIEVTGVSEWSKDNETSDDPQFLDYSDFDTVVVHGAWEVRITQHEEYSVEVSYPRSKGNEEQVRQEGDSLILGHRGWANYIGGHYSAEITMPNLGEIRVVGAAEVVFDGFDEKEISAVIDGIGRIKGKNSRTDRTIVKLDGLGDINFKDVVTIDAQVYLNGAGEVLLNMDGGVLEGRLDGLGSILYSGTLREERMHSDGIGRIERDD